MVCCVNFAGFVCLFVLVCVVVCVVCFNGHLCVLSILVSINIYLSILQMDRHQHRVRASWRSALTECDVEGCSSLCAC